MAICGVEQVLHPLVRHLCNRSAITSANQCHISLPHCLCTTAAFCTGALGPFKHFGILRESTLVPEPKMKMGQATRLSAWENSIQATHKPMRRALSGCGAHLFSRPWVPSAEAKYLLELNRMGLTIVSPKTGKREREREKKDSFKAWLQKRRVLVFHCYLSSKNVTENNQILVRTTFTHGILLMLFVYPSPRT